MSALWEMLKTLWQAFISKPEDHDDVGGAR
jgi:hypothetical protein